MFDTIYYVDYYDMNDGWIGFDYINEFRKDRIFTDYDKATICCAKLNSKLAFGNVRCGEYYDVKSPDSKCDFTEVPSEDIKFDGDFTIC